MKVNGVKLSGPRIVKVYLPYGDDGGLEFKFRPLRSTDDFTKVMTAPKPPELRMPGGNVQFNREDPIFKAALNDWILKKIHWEFLTSMSETEGLEFSTVEMDKPDTWQNANTELANHFGEQHINKLWQGFQDANTLTEESMERARASFLIGRQERDEQSHSPTAGQEGTQSGGPVNE